MTVVKSYNNIGSHIPTVGTIIFETFSLVTVTSERVSKIMAPTVSEGLCGDLGHNIAFAQKV